MLKILKNVTPGKVIYRLFTLHVPRNKHVILRKPGDRHIIQALF